MAQAEEHRIKEYLLGQLTEAEEEQVEVRLLTDPVFAEEYDIVVNELIDDYASGKFQGQELEQMESHFFTSTQRRDKLKFALALNAPAVKELKARMAADKGKKRRFTPYLAIAASVVLLAGGGFFIWRVVSNNSDLNQGLAALQSAFREERPLEARISKFDYAPYVTTRGPGAEKIDQDELRRAELTLLDAVKKNATPAVHHGLGKVYLAKKDFDKAIKEFDEALKGDPKNAQLYSDLAAAWLEKGKIDRAGKEPGKSTEEFSRSFEYLNKALLLDPNLLEALFNRALCEEQMSLNALAENDWREYFKRDPNSAWADEARRKVQRLEEQRNKIGETKEELLQDFVAAYKAKDDEAAWLIISRQRDLSGGLVANALIDAHLDLASRGQREESLKQLDTLFYAAKLEQNKAGDLFVRDVARFLGSASPDQRKSLVEARQLLQLGRKDLYGDKPALAAEHLNHAKGIFERIGDQAQAIYTEYPIGHSYLQQLKSDLSLATFDRVVQEAEVHEYKWLKAQALNATANTQIGRTNYSAALETSQRSLDLSKEIGDTTGVIKTTNQLAQQYFRLGNYTKSLDLHQQSLALANVVATEPIQTWRNYFTIAMPLSAMGLDAAAIEYEKEALRRAEDLKMPGTVCRSYSILGLMHARQGDYEEAIRCAKVAIDLAQKISSESAKKEAIAYSSLQLGLIYRLSGDFGNAITNYDQAIQLYRELENFQAFGYVAHKGKLLSCMREEGCISVEEEIKICLDLFETYRWKILEESNRGPFFDTEQDIYDVAIDYEFSRNHFQTAFDYSERARARSLLDLTSNETKLIGGPVEPDIRFHSVMAAKGFEEVKAGIPAEAQVLQYAVLRDRLVIWLISNTDLVSKEQAIPVAELNEILHRFIKNTSSPSGNTEELATDGLALYDILIKPVESSLKKDKLLCIVPDKTLNYLPFGALIASGSGKYLINDYRLILAPSSTMFLQSTTLGNEKDEVETESLLSVGNPRFSRERFPQLPDLPSAAREAQTIKQYYTRSKSRDLLAGGATKALVEAGMKHADVVHLAVHAIVDEETPLRSKLVLAAGGIREESSDDSALYAYEISESSLPFTRLVVLSACETGVGRYYRGEGIIGLSRTFLAARVPLVIGSLWRVDSDSTADLMIAFHRHRKTENLSTAAALQKAQQDMLNSSDQRYQHPYYWAAFTLVGGYARF